MKKRLNKNRRPEGSVRQSYGLVGRVKIGEIVEGVSKYGKKYKAPSGLDYFRFAPMNSNNKNCPFVETAEQIYANTPENKRNVLKIYFQSDSSEDCLNLVEMRDKGGRLVATSDRDTFVQLSLTKGLEGWVKPIRGKLKSIQRHPKSYIDLVAADFASEEGQISECGLPTLQQFLDKIEKRQKQLAGRNADKIEWKEFLRLRFGLVDMRVLGKWEFRTKGERSTIPEILEAYDSVMAAKGTVVGTQFLLKVDRVTQNRATDEGAKTYSMVSMVPLLSKNDFVEGNLILPAIDAQQGNLAIAPPPKQEQYKPIKVTKMPEDSAQLADDFGEDLPFEEG